MAPEWKTNEYGTRTWTYKGWTIKVWATGDSDVTGPHMEDVEVDTDRDILILRHEVEDGGHYGARNTVSVSVPLPVLLEYLKVVRGEV